MSDNKSTNAIVKKCDWANILDIGETVKVDSRTLPTGQIDIPEDEIPPFYDARIVSLHKNSNGVQFKVAIRAPWMKHMYFAETGWEDAGVERDKYFTYSPSAIGRTVFRKEEV